MMLSLKSFRNPPQSTDKKALVETLGKNDLLTFEYLQGYGTSSSAEISAGTGIPVRTIRDALNRLIEAGLVLAAGQGKGRSYYLIERSAADDPKQQ